MAFLRIKNIKNKQGKLYPYVYLVENLWKNKKVKQKVSKYLGRAIHLEKTSPIDLFESLNTVPENYLKKKKNNEIIKDLLTWTLSNHGFAAKKELMTNKDLSANPSTGEITQKKGKNSKNKKNNIILNTNNGFLCKYTISRLKRFKKTNNEEKDKRKLAVYFVESGINVPKEVFVEFYTNAPEL